MRRAWLAIRSSGLSERRERACAAEPAEEEDAGREGQQLEPDRRTSAAGPGLGDAPPAG